MSTEEKTTLKEIVDGLQAKILEIHGSDVGYKLHAQDGDAAISVEVFVPRGNGGLVPKPREKLTPEMVEQALTDAGYGDQPLKVEEVDGKILVKKTKKVDPWAEVNDVLRGLGLRWVSYDENDKANTGLWREP